MNTKKLREILDTLPDFKLDMDVSGVAIVILNEERQVMEVMRCNITKEEFYEETVQKLNAAAFDLTSSTNSTH